VPLAVENLRLKELAAVTALNRPAFDYLVQFLQGRGYASLHAFVMDPDETRAGDAIFAFLTSHFPKGIALYDGIARPYAPDKARWLLMGWVLRDAPEQRLRPMISSMAGNSTARKQSALLNKVRAYVSEIFPNAEKWEWNAISEVVIDRLEGSRRAIKGTLFEAIVRRHLTEIFADKKLPVNVSDTEIRLEGETYDVSVIGKRGKILMPVKTRETMGGGHALIFTRDIHKSIHAAHEAGFDCLPVVIAESWGGNLKALDCKDFIYIDLNPNQVKEVEPILRGELEKRLEAFRSIT
jgi:hypothetical protein